MADTRRRLARRAALALPLAVMLAACGGDGPQPPGAETVGEVRALDDAAEMLAGRRSPSSTASAVPPASPEAE